MKRISLLVVAAITLAMLTATYSQTPPSAKLRKVKVTPRTIASQPAGKPLVIDLTHTGTIYALAAGIDCSRVRLRTLSGEKVMCSVVKQLGTRGELLVGNDRIEDLYSKAGLSSKARAGGSNQFTCTTPGAGMEGSCKCTNIIDCLLMLHENPGCKVKIIDHDTGVTYCIGPLGP